MDITDTFEPADRAAWRAWLAANHHEAREIWVIASAGTATYLDLVEEALCYGWIDGIAKRDAAGRGAQRFTPRRPKGNWTELNKERARRLIAAGLMTEAGRRALPDLDPASFRIPDDVREALVAAGAWENFCAFPSLYQRVRVGYVVEQRKDPAEFAKRLQNLVAKSAANETFGRWDDLGLARTPGPGGPPGG